MSHFSVLVVTPDAKPETLAKALQPYHEFECTGTDDEFVVDVDRTEELRAEYATGTVSRYRDAAGSFHPKYEDQFYREPNSEDLATIGRPGFGGTGWGDGIHWTSKDWGDGLGYRTKVHYRPEGFDEVEIPVCEVMTFAEFCSDDYAPLSFGASPGDQHKSGRVELNEDGTVARVIRRTNPNAKWDWWKIGGRYAGRIMKNGSLKSCDAARFDAIDFEAMRAYQVQKRRINVDEIRAEVNKALGMQGLADMAYMEAAHKAKTAGHKAWQALSEPRPRGGDYFEWIGANFGEGAAVLCRADTWDILELSEGQTIAEWIEAAPPLSAYAVLKDGQWHASGEMGWFGVSTGEVSDWPTQFAAILKSIKPDEFITIVDCHI